MKKLWKKITRKKKTTIIKKKRYGRRSQHTLSFIFNDENLQKTFEQIYLNDDNRAHFEFLNDVQKYKLIRERHKLKVDFKFMLNKHIYPNIINITKSTRDTIFTIYTTQNTCMLAELQNVFNVSEFEIKQQIKREHRI
jgi:hypothetical protein